MDRVDMVTPRVPVTLRKQTNEDAAAVRAFNERLIVSRCSVPFFLPEIVATGGSHQREHWILTDGDDVRGGVLLTRHQAVVAGESCEVVNLQAPLTEGIADSRYASLSVWMFRELERRFRFVYAVGMGGLDRPLPRLLIGLRWQVALSAFRFVPFRPKNVVRQVPAVQQRIPAPLIPFVTLAASAGGPVYRAWLRFRGAGTLEEARPGDDACGVIASAWKHAARDIAFGVARDAQATRTLFSKGDDETVFRVHGDNTCCAVVRVRKLSNSSQFPQLRVATLLELMAPDAARLAVLSRRVLAHLSDTGADLAITNMTNRRMVQILDDTGWLAASSNYVVALSRAFEKAGVSLDESHVSRTDGDGRLNL